MKWTLALALVILAAACGRSGSEGEGSVSILLTDGAEARLDSAVVTISRITLQPGTGDPIVLRDAPITLDVVGLANETETLVDGAIVPDGEYAQLRFLITSSFIVVDDSTLGRRVFATATAVVPDGKVDGELQTPSWDASGLKVRLPGGTLTVEDDARVLVVDFDLAESIGHPADDAWVLSPVLEALDIELTATIGVEVRVAADAVAPSGLRVRLTDAKGLFEGELPLDDDDDDEALEATFRWVDPREGPFTVALVAPTGVALQAWPSSSIEVDVTSGQAREVDFEIQAVIP